ncbi:DUF2804 domain-containing protein [uncultured Acinetobacter sp.]|uniref:DUF2804 domain-containing protein n=1 Tax=uncultured Acinetobacter sp. TaxID=165433 RepID=UPI0025878A9B|nr:DUF2804 domain-containing protein [uncultured Acinetobacter sp.]
MDLIQDNGQPRFGRFSQQPSAISTERYIYKSPYGKVERGWRKKIKYKKFKFCSIQHQHYTLGVAIADIGWAGHGFFYLYNHATQEVLEWNALQPFARKTQVDEQPLFNHSFFYASAFELDIQHANGVRYIRVTRYGEILLSARIFCAGTQALSLCSPNGINGWTYTHKKTALTVEGCFTNKQGQLIEFDQKSMASLDDTCGFLRPETAWFWLSCNFWHSQDQKIGINLASGVNESFGNENCIWVNGVLYPVADVLFEQLDAHHWQIHSLDRKLNLKVTTGWRRYENLNLRMVGSRFSQWQARISGTIDIEGQDRLEFEQELGLLEQHYAKW